MERHTLTNVQSDSRGNLGYQLVVASGSNFGTILPLDRPRLTIGNLETCDLVLEDTFVSRVHCEIVLERGSHILTDLNSKNGTFINGLRVSTVRLIPGALIRVGSTDLFYQVSEGIDQLPMSPVAAFGDLLGRSAGMRRLFTLLSQISPTDLTILIEGETGTGKDLVAQNVHQHSKYAKGPFIVLDCGAVAPNLIESELFGHDRGAFTGADRERRGAFERAKGGTVFLDEIGELSLNLQPKLLRVLEQREFHRVGGNTPLKAEVRVLAATNRNLAEEVKAGRFRQDLYFRLSVLQVKLPPLRERQDDIPLLVEHMLRDQVISESKKPIQGLSPEALHLLIRHPWQGNIRELKNVIQRAMTLSSSSTLQAKDLYFEPLTQEAVEKKPTVKHLAQPVSLQESERQQIIRSLKECNWNKSEAAIALGIASSTLYAKLKKHKITKPE